LLDLQGHLAILGTMICFDADKSALFTDF